MLTKQVKLTLSKAKEAELNKILERRTRLADTKDGTVIESFTVNFGDDIEADLNIVNGDGPYLDVVFFHKGSEIGCSEPSWSMGGSHAVEYFGQGYEVVIETEGA